jgi:hypothetical protein
VRLQVCCARGNEPRALLVGERRLHVVCVLERTVEEAHHWYRVRVIDGREFLLHYELRTGGWWLDRVSAGRARI